jgi:hypothetical protein
MQILLAISSLKFGDFYRHQNSTQDEEFSSLRMGGSTGLPQLSAFLADAV